MELSDSIFTLIHATSESTFRFWLATGHNGQRTNSYAHKLDLYYEGAIVILQEDNNIPATPVTFDARHI